MKRIVVVFLALCVLLSVFVAPVMAESKADTGTNKGQVIRVAFPKQEGLTQVDKEGNYSGYVFEYLQEISQYTGWEYEFVETKDGSNESLLSLMKMVEDGEVDLIGGLLYNEALTQIYDYASYSMGTVYTTLSALAESGSAEIMGLTSKQTMRIAVTQTSGDRIDELYAYCKMNQITPKLVICDSTEEQYKALKENTADMMLNVSLNPVDGVKDMARFAPRPFYCAVTKGRDDLVSKLNNAIYNIEQSDPYYSARLFEKYFARRAENFAYSEEEKEYLKDTKILRMGILESQPPFAYKTDGQFTGISEDMVRHVEKETGLKFRFVPAASEDELDALIKDQKVDLVAGVIYDYNQARDRNISMTQPYAVSQKMMVTNSAVKDGEVSDRILAKVERDREPVQRFEGRYAYYPNTEECIKAVNSGKADYTYTDGFSAQYYANQAKFDRIKILPITSENIQTSFGVTKPIDDELLSILNKVILNADQDEMHTLIYQNLSRSEELTLATLMRENPFETIILIACILLCIIGALLWGLRNRTRLNRRLALDMKKHMQVYEIASERFFEYDFSNEKLIVSGSDFDWKEALDGFFQIDETGKPSEFIVFLTTTKEGTVDLQRVKDGEEHWSRFTIKTLYDGEIPAFVVGKIVNVDEEYKEKKKLIYLAEHDGLTALLNVNACRDQIQKSIDGLSTDEHGSFLLMDIDDFKLVNDTYGHMEGDRVLIEVANTMRRVCSDKSILCRLGGDEFVIYLERVTSDENLEVICADLSNHISKVGFADGRHVTCSIGAVKTSRGGNYKDAFNEADQLLYLAKDKGRNRYELSW